MKKLELKQVQVYLSENLKVLYKTTFNDSTEHKSIDDLTTHNIMEVVNSGKYQLILNPLSIFQEMKMVDVKDYLNCSNTQLQEVFNLMNGDVELVSISYGLFEKMCQKHIDFNNLIEQGLAVDEITAKKL